MGALRVCAVAAPEKLRLAYEKTFPLPGNYSVQVLLHSIASLAVDSCLVRVSGHFSSWHQVPVLVTLQCPHTVACTPVQT